MNELPEPTRSSRWRSYLRRFTKFSLRTFLIASAASAIGLWLYFAPRRPEFDRTMPGGIRLITRLSQYTQRSDTSEQDRIWRISQGEIIVRNAQGRYLLRGSFAAGKGHGKWVYYYDSGRRRRAGRFEHGVQVGRWREWHENGRLATDLHYSEAVELREGDTSDDQQAMRRREGSCRAWWENGRPRYAGMYASGRREGIWTYWDKEGQVVTQGTYRQSIKHGNWQEFDEASGKHVDVHYVMGHVAPPRDQLLSELGKGLTADDWETRHRAIDTLTYLGEEGATAIGSSLMQWDVDERRFALRCLREMGSEASTAIASIEPLTEGGSDAQRIEAFKTLLVLDVHHRDHWLARVLQFGTRNERDVNRIHLFHTIVDLKEILLPPAEKLLKDDTRDAAVRQAVLELLGVLTSNEAHSQGPDQKVLKGVRNLLRSEMNRLPSELQAKALSLLKSIEEMPRGSKAPDRNPFADSGVRR